MAAYRIRRNIAAVAATVLALAVVGTARAVPLSAADEAYAAELIARAHASNLADHRQWHTLVHYEPRTLGGVSSLIDSPSFFAAADGKTNPEAELEATIRSFFSHASPVDGQPPQCLRIARYRWLKEQLQFDPGRLEDQTCPDFEEWLRTLDAAEITLAYPSAYLNNPSSMFGHTLLRIDQPQQGEDTRLLSFAINFAADTGAEGGALFAVKGLAGGYRGFFSVMPYYEKVGQYSDIESRDIWEYHLKLKPREVRIMLEHLWELQGQYVNYYFLSTNCSYVLLSLINTARPDLDLTRGLDLYAIPVDTVRAAIRNGGLLGDIVFRPSGMTRIKDLRRGLTAEEQDLALALADGEVEPDAAIPGDPAETQARILELAQAMLQYRLNSGALGREVVAPRSLKLLRARAAIAIPSPATSEPPAVRPDEGHESVRLSAEVGMTGGNPFVEFGLRPAFHDLLDPPAGYPSGAAIEILGVRARAYLGDSPRLEDFTPVAINSLTSRDRFLRPLSWRTKLGVERFREDAEDAGWLVGIVEGAAGGTWAPGEGGAQVSALMGASLFADHESPKARIIGAGPELVLSWPLSSWWTTTIEARWQAVAGSDRLSDRYRATLGHGFHLGRNLSLRLEAGVRNDGGDPFAEWMTSLKWYF